MSDYAEALSQLAPGRKLDALVDERIFSRHLSLAVLPHWSTDVNAAMLLAEEINWLSFSISRENCSGVRWDCTMYNNVDCHPKINVTASTPAHAICMAVLRMENHD